MTFFTSRPLGANPTIASYNAANSLVRLENKNIFFFFEKRSSYLAALEL
jgi:hypothetical protein